MYQELEARLWAAGRFDRETVHNRQFHISGDGIGSHYDQHVIRRRYTLVDTCGQFIRGLFPSALLDLHYAIYECYKHAAFCRKLPNINATSSQLATRVSRAPLLL